MSYDFDDKMGSVNEIPGPQSGELSPSNKNSVPVLEKIAAFNSFNPFIKKNEIFAKKILENITIQLSIQTDEIITEDLAIIRNKQFTTEKSLESTIDRKKTKIRIIELSNNSLHRVPIDTLRRLTNLTAISLSRNKISILPPVFLSWFPSLVYLDLSFNQISSLSDDVFNPHIHESALTFVNLSNNCLKTLPKSLKLLKSLEVLSILSNDLESIPTSLWKNNRINVLKLSWMLYLVPSSVESAFTRNSVVSIDDLFGFLQSLRKKKMGFLTLDGFIKRFSEELQEFNSTDHIGRNILHMAIFRDDLGVCRHIVRRKRELMLKEDSNKINPFIFAMQEKKFKFAELFIENEVDVSCSASTHGSALHLAVSALKLKLVILLISKGASLTKTDSNGNTILHVVLHVFPVNRMKAAKIIMFIIARGVPLNTFNKKNELPIHIPVKENSSSCLRLLLSLNDDILDQLNTMKPWYPLEKWNMLDRQSIRSDSEDEIDPEKPEEIQEKQSRVDLNRMAVHMMKKTKIIWDKKMNKFTKESFERFFKVPSFPGKHPESFQIEGEEQQGNTILHLAAMHPNIQMIVAIGKRGPNPFLENNEGVTPSQLIPWDFMTSRKALLKIERAFVYRKFKIKKYFDKGAPIPPSDAMKNFHESREEVKGGKVLVNHSIGGDSRELASLNSVLNDSMRAELIKFPPQMVSMDQMVVEERKNKGKGAKAISPERERGPNQAERQKITNKRNSLKVGTGCNYHQSTMSFLLRDAENNSRQRDFLAFLFFKDWREISARDRESRKSFTDALVSQKISRILQITSEKIKLIVLLRVFLEKERINKTPFTHLNELFVESLRNLVSNDSFFLKDLQLLNQVFQKLKTKQNSTNSSTFELFSLKVLEVFTDNSFFNIIPQLIEDLKKSQGKINKQRLSSLLSMISISSQLGSRGYFDGKTNKMVDPVKLKALFIEKFPFLNPYAAAEKVPKSQGATDKKTQVERESSSLRLGVERNPTKKKSNTVKPSGAGAGANDMIYWEMDKEMNECEESYDLVKKKNFSNGILAFNHSKVKCKSDLD